MTTIISFANQKGGVGKTTSVINIAACLCKLDKKVLIIDMDPQGNTTQVYSTIDDTDLSVYNFLIKNGQQKPTPFESIKISTYIPQLDIMPSNVLLSSAELDLVNETGRETILKRLLKENHSQLQAYDFILIDCQPSLGLLTINSMIASDYILVPLHADIFSLTGLELLTETVKKLQHVFEINTTILGFFFTQVTPHHTLFKEAFELCKQTYSTSMLTTFIRNNTAIDHANATNQSILDFAPTASAAIDYKKLTKECLLKLSK